MDDYIINIALYTKIKAMSRMQQYRKPYHLYFWCRAGFREHGVSTVGLVFTVALTPVTL